MRHVSKGFVSSAPPHLILAFIPVRRLNWPISIWFLTSATPGVDWKGTPTENCKRQTDFDEEALHFLCESWNTGRDCRLSSPVCKVQFSNINGACFSWNPCCFYYPAEVFLPNCSPILFRPEGTIVLCMANLWPILRSIRLIWADLISVF